MNIGIPKTLIRPQTKELQRKHEKNNNNRFAEYFQFSCLMQEGQSHDHPADWGGDSHGCLSDPKGCHQCL